MRQTVGQSMYKFLSLQDHVNPCDDNHDLVLVTVIPIAMDISDIHPPNSTSNHSMLPRHHPSPFARFLNQQQEGHAQSISIPRLNGPKPIYPTPCIKEVG